MGGGSGGGPEGEGVMKCKTKGCDREAGVAGYCCDGCRKGEHSAGCDSDYASLLLNRFLIEEDRG